MASHGKWQARERMCGRMRERMCGRMRERERRRMCERVCESVCERMPSRAMRPVDQWVAPDALSLTVQLHKAGRTSQRTHGGVAERGSMLNLKL